MKTLFIITGASKGIGKGLAEKALETEQHEVIGLSRSHSIAHPNYKGIEIDLSNIEEVIKLNKQLISSPDTYERIVLINNAGTLGEVEHVGKFSDESIVQLMNLNVSAALILMNGFMRQLKDYQGQKVIFNISSGAGKRAVDGWSGYCASKAALDMATKVAYEENELDKNHFEIRAIAPGVVDTGMQDQIRASEKEAFSGVEKFQQLKANNELSDEQAVAEKYFQILEHLDQYPEAILDVRHI